MTCDLTTNGFVQQAGYVVGPSGEQLTEVDGSGNWKHTNVYAGGKLIATYDGNVAAPTLHFHIDDPLGTRRAQVSATGALEATYQSLPFGDGLNSIPYTNAGDDDPTENHFTGKERDSESGNDYFLARYYNSATGRFLSPDWSVKHEPVPYAKLDNPQSLNLYSYVLNNPLRTTDPDGHADDPCKDKSDCYVTKDDKNKTMTVTQTSTQTTKSKDAQGNELSTTTRTTNTETVSTADANKGQVLGGSTTTNTTTVNLTDKSIVSETNTTKDLNPLQAMNAVGSQLTEGLQEMAQPSMMDRLMDHKVGASGVVAGGAAGACALAEPCGAVVGTGALIGAGVYAAGAAIYDFATH
jgi:RHS repeat-associated protein